MNGNNTSGSTKAEIFLTSFTPWPFYPLEKKNQHALDSRLFGPIAGLRVIDKRKISGQDEDRTQSLF